MHKFVALFLSPISYLFLSVPVFAAGTAVLPATTGSPLVPCPAAPFDILCTFGAQNFGGIIGAIINFLFVVAVIIAVIYLLYGGIKWIMSRGDKSQVEEARNHIVAAVVGLIVVFLAFFIINIILSLFLNTNVQNLKIPSINVSPIPTQ